MVFFSGTDTDTLLEKATEHSFFTSLIVNNRLEKIAKISYAGKVKTVQTFYNRLGNIILPYSKDVEEEVVFVIDCNVSFENEGCTDLELLDQIKDAEEARTKREEGRKKTYVPSFKPSRFVPEFGVERSSDSGQLSMFSEKSLETKFKDCKLSLTEKCKNFAKKLLCIDYTGDETRNLSLKEARDLFKDYYQDVSVDVYLEEVTENLEDFFCYAFERELRANNSNESLQKLRKMLSVEFANIFDNNSEIERKLLEQIDHFMKTSLKRENEQHSN